MPIEIRELSIKATVGEAPNPEQQSSSQSSESRGSGELDQEAIIAACVSQVLQILKDQQER